MNMKSAAALLHRAAPQGLLAVNADGAAAADASRLLNDLQSAFEEFKAANDDRLKAVETGKADVLIDERVDRINASVTELQTAVDALAQQNASLSLGGAGEAGTDPEYVQAFTNWFRTGKGDEDVEARQFEGVRAAMDKGTPADGGYLAPIEWDRTITDKLKIVSPMRSICRVQPISGNSFKRVYNDRATASGWVGETAARPQTAQAQFGELQFDTGELYAMPAATKQLLDDAVVNVDAWLGAEVQTEFAYQEGLAYVSGDGSNKPFGFLTYVTGGANAAKHPWGAIARINSGAAAAVTSDGLIDLVYALPTERAERARFVMNRATVGDVRKLKDGDGNYIWRPGLGEGQPATLLGYPTTEIAAMPNIAANAMPIAFGDFERGYLIVDRQGVFVLRDPYTNKPYIRFYTTKRVGGGVNDPEAIKVLQIAE